MKVFMNHCSSINKGVFWSALGFVFVALCASASAQQAKKIPRIGFITTGYPVSIANLLEGFKQGLREHGYVEGQMKRVPDTISSFNDFARRE